MSRLIGLAVRLLSGVEHAVDRVRHGPDAPGAEARDGRVVAYDGFGTAHGVTVLGRVLRNPPVGPTTADATLWENLVATYRRFETDQVPDARLHIRAGAIEREVVADHEGHFRARLVFDAPLPDDRLWHDVEYTLLWPPPTENSPLTVGRALVPSPLASYGVISDIDDTVVQSDVRQVLRMLRTVIFGNARTRLPFPGVAAFYRALEAGVGGGGPNPLFYVSSSPWNLHDLLAEFFDLQGIPRGPLLLRDWGIQAHDLAPTRHGSHKQAAIRLLLNTYPRLDFLLIGDSGQEDPEIYASIVRDFPGRIAAVYIRDVTRDAERTRAITALAHEVERGHGTTLLLVEDTVAAARHAAERGWIDPAHLRAIAGEAEADYPGGTPAAPTVIEG